MSTIDRTAHGLVAGQRVVFANLVGGSPIDTDVVYFVQNPTANNFQISETEDGTPLTFATLTSADMSVVPETTDSDPPIAITATAATDLVNATAHGFIAGDIVFFATLVGGTGLATDTTYYVLSSGLTANAFKVSLADGGPAVDITVDYTSGTVIRAASYTATTTGHVMEPPTTPVTPTAPTVSSSLISGIVRLTITLAASAAGKLRATEVQFTHKFSDIIATGGNLTGVAATNLITSASAHSFVADDKVRFTALTGGAGLIVGQDYFIIASGLTSTTFKVSTTLAGAEFDFTTDITAGTCGEVVAAYPVWTNATTYTLPENTLTLTAPALGSTVYKVRVREQDVYGLYSAFSAEVEHTTTTGDDALQTALASLANDVADGIITETKIADNAISTPKLQAGSVTASVLAATLILASLIKTAASGRRVEIDSFGIRLLDSDDTLLVNIPTDVNQSVYVKGAIDASNLTVNDSTTLRKVISLAGDSVTTAQSGVSNPGSAPVLVASVDSLAITSPGGVSTAAGIGVGVGTAYWIAADPTAAGGYVAHEINASTGALIRSILKTGSITTVTTTLGSTSHVSDTAEARSGSTLSHIATPLTLPSGLTNIRITKVSVYCTGYSGSASVRNGIWDDVTGTGNLLRESASYTVPDEALSPGNSNHYDKSLSSELSVAAGATIYAGFRHTSSSEGFQWDRDDGSGKTTKGGDGTTGDGTGWATHNSASKPNVYITYKYDINTQVEDAAMIGVCVAPVSTTDYVWTLDANGILYQYLHSDGSFVAEYGGLAASITGAKSKAGLFYDATAARLVITTADGTGSAANIRFLLIDTNSPNSVASTITGSGFTFNGNTAAVRGGARLNDPLNASTATYWVPIDGTVKAFVQSTGAYVADRDFGTSATCLNGLTYYSAAFRGWAVATPTKVWAFSAWDWTTANANYWLCYTWRDDGGAVGGNVTGVAATNLLTTASAHGFAVNDQVRFTSLTGGTGLSIDVDYYVIASGLTTTAFRVSTTQGGGEVDFTTDVTAGAVVEAHETAVSPRATLLMRRRERVQVTTPTIPTGGGDDPNKCRVYMLPNATDPGSGASYKLQVTDAATSRYLTDYASGGAANPASNNFPAGTPAEIRSAVTDGWHLKGSGLSNWGGTAFPSSPATNDQFYRTDLGEWYYYDGTRWLCTVLHYIPVYVHNDVDPVGSIAATTPSWHRGTAPQEQGASDIWLEEYIFEFYVSSGGSALSASHKWTFDLYSWRDGTATTDLLGTLVVDSGSSAVARRGVVTLNALLNASFIHVWLQVDATKTGTPGNVESKDMLTWRHVG